MSDHSRLVSALLRKLRAPLRRRSNGGVGQPASAGRAGTSAKRPNPRSGPSETAARPAYPGDFHGVVHPQYSPNLNGRPDPGEIVWTWVPFEEDYSRGKDRPVLLIGHDGKWLIALMLSSTDHTGSTHLGPGERWLDIGRGPWDRQGRDSEIRLDRKIRVDPASMRREGAIVPSDVYHRIVSQT